MFQPVAQTRSKPQRRKIWDCFGARTCSLTDPPADRKQLTSPGSTPDDQVVWIGSLSFVPISGRSLIRRHVGGRTAAADAARRHHAPLQNYQLQPREYPPGATVGIEASFGLGGSGPADLERYELVPAL
jgi:hypothetical protein